MVLPWGRGKRRLCKQACSIDTIQCIHTRREAPRPVPPVEKKKLLAHMESIFSWTYLKVFLLCQKPLCRNNAHAS